MSQTPAHLRASASGHSPIIIKSYLLIPVLSVILFTSGCGAKKEARDSAEEFPTPVQVAKAIRGSIEHIVTAQGVLYPIRQSAITPKITAPVQHFLVNRGDHVREGQLIAQLENRDLVASALESKALYTQAESQYQTVTGGTLPEDMIKARTDLDSARQALDAAKRVYESRVALVKEGALAQRLADDAKVAMVQAQGVFDTAQRHLESLRSVSRAAQIKTAQSQVEAAQAHYQSSQAQVDYSEVRSPITGIIADRPTSDGEMANAGSPLMTIVDISQIVARVHVPVANAADVNVGDKAVITSADGDLDGKVTVVSPAVDPSSTTLEVWVQAANPHEKFKPGTTANVSIEAGTVPDAVIVPVSALLASDEGGSKVMVVGPDSTAQERPVKAGVRQGDNVQILDGIEPGDQVVTVGGVGLEDKTKVVVQATGTGKADKDDKDATEK
ncbi:MAG TPA: efflux RND transporter periplasmic adaptor subunit [Bryobacteraceae bacterium]|nr:efflux RND transporter periplasmic adaptor subunit [Bryobacteraceae bacterium]